MATTNVKKYAQKEMRISKIYENEISNQRAVCNKIRNRIGKHRRQKPTSFTGLPMKWRVSPKTDDIMGNSGTATGVPVMPVVTPQK